MKHEDKYSWNEYLTLFLGEWVAGLLGEPTVGLASNGNCKLSNDSVLSAEHKSINAKYNTV